MSLAAIIDAMVATGCTPEQIAAAVRANEAERSAADEARREKSRLGNAERQRRKRENDRINNARHAVTGVTQRDECDEPSPDKEGPQTPKEITLIQDNPSPPKGGSVPLRPAIATKPKSDFPPEAFEAHFWPVYPRKEGKGAARKVFDRIQSSGKVTWADLLAGLQRFARAPPEPRFTPHAATWLNAERWTDEPANPATESLFGANRSGPREDSLISAARREIDGMRGGGWDGIPPRNANYR